MVARLAYAPIRSRRWWVAFVTAYPHNTPHPLPSSPPLLSFPLQPPLPQPSPAHSPFPCPLPPLPSTPPHSPPHIFHHHLTSRHLSKTVGPDSFNASLDAVHGLLSVNFQTSHQQHPPPQAPPPPPPPQQPQAQVQQPQQAQAQAQAQESSPAFVVNENNRLLWSSAEALGLLPEVIPRNVKGCVDCGHCSHGCPHDAKQSTATALIEPILRRQQQQQQQQQSQQQQQQQQSQQPPPQSQSQSQSRAANNASVGEGEGAGTKGRLTLIANCQVLRILTQPISLSSSSSSTPSSSSSSSSSSNSYSTTVCGVEALWSEHSASDPLNHPIGPNRAPPTTTKHLLFRAPLVVSSSGALHTPALLLRSGLKHPKIGRHLCLHPVVAVAGLMSDQVDTGLSKGVGMGVIVRSTRARAGAGASTTDGCTNDVVVDSSSSSSSNIRKTLYQGVEGVSSRCQEVSTIIGHRTWEFIHSFADDIVANPHLT